MVTIQTRPIMLLRLNLGSYSKHTQGKPPKAVTTEGGKDGIWRNIIVT